MYIGDFFFVDASFNAAVVDDVSSKCLDDCQVVHTAFRDLDGCIIRYNFGNNSVVDEGCI